MPISSIRHNTDPCIPVSQLLAWYEGRRIVHDSATKELGRIASTDQSGDDPDVMLMAGRVDGSADTLTSFADFLISAARQSA